MNPLGRFWLAGLFVFLCLVGLMGPPGGAPAHAVSVKTLEQKHKTKQAQIKRIREIKRRILVQERHVTYNILKNQKRLESTRVSMQEQQGQMDATRSKINALEAQLDAVVAEQQRLGAAVGKRLRSIYMGERMGFLQMLIEAGDVSTLLDRMYYKKRIFAQDKKLYAAYILKTRALEAKKNAMIEEKNRLSKTIQRIQTYQSQLKESVELDRMLVHKLQTSREAYDMAENQLERESYAIERQILSQTKKGGYVVGSTGRFAPPVYGPIRSGFGYRVHPIFRTRRFHSGVDFGSPRGTPIRAADGGVVIASGWQGGYGKVVILNHGSQNGANVATLYGHMSRTAVGYGQHVTKGEVIGYVGSTGYSTGPHLHFEVRLNGRPVNPMAYFR